MLYISWVYFRILFTFSAAHLLSIQSNWIISCTLCLFPKADDTEAGTVQITYRIVAGQTPDNAFAIDRITGQLRLNKFLSYENTSIGANGQNTG